MESLTLRTKKLKTLFPVLIAATMLSQSCDSFHGSSKGSSDKKEEQQKSNKKYKISAADLKILEDEFGAKVVGNTLTTKNGKTFELIKWKYPFHRRLRGDLKDLKAEAIILKRFADVFSDFDSYSKDDKQKISDWVNYNFAFLGKELDDDVKKYVIHDNRVTSMSTDKLAKVEEFYVKVSKDLRDTFKTGDKSGKNIPVLTTSGGGGHLSVAKAVKSLLEQSAGGYKAVFVDEKVDFETSDALFIASSGKLSYETVYNTIYQQQGDHARADRLWRIGRDILTDFIPLDMAGKMREKAASMNAPVIVNTLHHRSEYVGMSNYHNIRQLIISTDYDVPGQNHDAVQKAHSDLIKYLLPSDSYHLFEETYNRMVNTYSLRNERGDLIAQYFEQQKSDIDFLNTKGDVFRVQGIPGRLSFDVNLYDAAKKTEIRRNNNIPDGFKPIIVAFGAQGGETISTFVDFLDKNSDALAEPVHVFSIAGRNQELQKKMEQFTPKDSTKLKVSSLGFVTEKPFAELFAVSSILVGKPGGLTVTECYYMNLPLLALDYHEWEIRNLNVLNRIGLGTKVDKDKWETDLLPTFNQMISNPPAPNADVIDWKANFIQNINEFLDKEGVELVTVP